MIDYLQGYILLAYRDLIVYCNVTDVLIDGANDEEEVKSHGVASPNTTRNRSESNFTECEVQQDALCYLDLHKDYKIICIQEIGNEMSALVLEDKQTRQIRFLRCLYMEGKVDSSLRRLKLV